MHVAYINVHNSVLRKSYFDIAQFWYEYDLTLNVSRKFDAIKNCIFMYCVMDINISKLFKYLLNMFI